MAPRALSDADLEALRSWPPEVAHSDLVEYFTLDVDDLRWVRSHRGAATRLGLAVQLCGLRFLGFVPADLASTPPDVTQRLAERVRVAPSALSRYVATVDGRLRRLHVASVVERAGWRSCGRSERKRLADWLVARALEHDDPSLLFAQALEHLRAEHVVRPGLDRLQREIAEARAVAHREILWRLRPELSPECCAQLDALATNDPELGMAPLTWLDKGAVSSTPDAIKAEVAKLAYLRQLGADRVDLSALPPERARQLAAVGRRSKPKDLRAMVPERRHPILLATVAGAYAGILDELVQMLGQAWARPRAGRGRRSPSASWPRPRPTPSAWSCSTRSSRWPSTTGSTTPVWGRGCAPWGGPAWRGRCAPRRSVRHATGATWSGSRPDTRTCVRSPLTPWPRCGCDRAGRARSSRRPSCCRR